MRGSDSFWNRSKWEWLGEGLVPTSMVRCGLQMTMSSWAKQLRLDSGCIAVAMTVSLRKLFSGGLCSKWEKDRLLVIMLAETEDRWSQCKSWVCVPRQQAILHIVQRSQYLTEVRKMPHFSQQFQTELRQDPTTYRHHCLLQHSCQTTSARPVKAPAD